MSVSPISTLDIGTLQPTYAADPTAWDTTPTSGSNKPVTSEAIYTALTGNSYANVINISKPDEEATSFTFNIATAGTYMCVVRTRFYQGTYTSVANPLFYYTIRIDSPTKEAVSGAYGHAYAFTSLVFVADLSVGSHTFYYADYGSGGKITSRGNLFLVK